MMLPLPPEQPPLHSAAEHVRAIRSLIDEVTCAMQAIADNRIPEFRASLARQQIHCASLRNAAVAAREPEAAGFEASPELAASRAELLHIARSYEKLVAGSRRSAMQLAALCSSYAGQYARASCAPGGKHSISCEA